MFPLLIDCANNHLIDRVQDGNCSFCGLLDQDQSWQIWLQLWFGLLQSFIFLLSMLLLLLFKAQIGSSKRSTLEMYVTLLQGNFSGTSAHCVLTPMYPTYSKHCIYPVIFTWHTAPRFRRRNLHPVLICCGSWRIGHHIDLKFLFATIHDMWKNISFGWEWLFYWSCYAKLLTW